MNVAIHNLIGVYNWPTIHTILYLLRMLGRKWKWNIPFIFNDKSTGSCTCLRLDLYLSHVKITCATADSFCSLFTYPHNPRSHTCAYVTHMKYNVSRSIEIRQVIHDTRISNGQWPRRDVTNLCGACAVQWSRSYKISGRWDIYMSICLYINSK
jgi:hypothetical protein